jgi:hypothetical protein
MRLMKIIDMIVEDKVLFRKTNVSIASTNIILFRVGIKPSL